MSTAPPPLLERGAGPWLFATALAALLPHFAHQPAWLSGMSALILASGAGLWWHGRRRPGRWLLVLLVAAASAGILLEFRTPLGRQAGIATLMLFMGLKLLEMKSRRDAYVVVNLAYFLLLTHYFNSQSIATGLWLLGAATVITATLVRVHGGPASRPLPTLRHAGTMLLQSLPFMLALYLLFPRIAGPLWGLPQDAQSARTGLSGEMSPGSIASLVLNADIAFRARFAVPIPARDKLYWRGPVLEDYDGGTWRQRLFSGAAAAPLPAVEAVSPPLSYEITLEPHRQHWLLALDAPLRLPPETSIAPTLSVLAREAVGARQRHSLAAALDYRFNVRENAAVLARSLKLPAGRDPRTRALAAEWRQAAGSPENLVQRALRFFNEAPFAYTLHPPLLGENAVDDFLFRSRKGFCEHYASAFVVLMRAAGIPARVVTGYQGGELNPIDGYLVVRHSDAHAWAEVWLAGRGWVRVDPTAAVSPARIRSGIAASLPDGEALPALAHVDLPWLNHLRHRWDALNNTWNQWIIGYNPQRQRDLLSHLGLPDADWRTLAPLLLAACGTALLAVIAWTLKRRPPADPALRQWQRALARLRRQQVDCAPWETPWGLVERLHNERPDLVPAMEAVAAAYCRARYGPGPADIRALKESIARLP